MARTKISEFSATPASNTDIDSIFIGEGMAPSNVNDAIRELMSQLKDWQSGTSNDPYVVGSSGSLTLNQGTANTVPYLNGSKVVTSGTELQFDGTNLGLGVTPSAWSGTVKAFEFPQGALFGEGTAGAFLTSNAFYNGTNYIYKNSSFATYYSQSGGNHRWFNAPSGTAGNAITFTQAMTLNASGQLGIGTTSPDVRLFVSDSANDLQMRVGSLTAGIDPIVRLQGKNVADTTARYADIKLNADAGLLTLMAPHTAGPTINALNIDSSGNLLVGKTTTALSTEGTVLSGSNASITNGATDGTGENLVLNRHGSDGTLVRFYQAGTQEGSISVSGTTVSYNGGHLSRWAQTLTPKDETLVKGTVLSNLDEMNSYTDAEGNAVDNEQLNKVKVSDVEGDVNVAGVFVNWSHDDAHNVDEINMAMTGDMIIRIAQGTTVARGDLLMSAGNGTAKPQGDDIVRSKTVAKVTSTNVTCTYADGSYCVPCVLMAC